MVVEKLTNTETRKSRKATNNDILAIKIRTERNRFAPVKVFIVAFLLLFQVSVLIAAQLFFITLFRWFVVISLVLSIITAIYILSTNKNSQSKAVWVMFVLICFLFGYFIYFISDDRISFSNSRKLYKKIYKESENALTQKETPKILNSQVACSCEYLKSAGDFNAFNGTNVAYFATGTKFFDSILKEIEKSQNFIFIEYYIISDGILFSRMLDILKAKAQAGVDVRIIFDDLGSFNTLSHKTKKEMKKAGIKLGRFNPLVSRFSVALNFRDHRKLLIVDGKVAYTGGANLADEYVNEKRLHGYWKDSGIRIEGLAVDSFVLCYLRQWQFVTHTKVDYQKFLGHAEKMNSTSAVVPFVDGLDFQTRIGKGLVESIISSSTEKLWIMTPYFIPDDTITNLLMQKAMAGVDVRIILPEIADKKMVYVVSRTNAEKLMKSGVKIFVMKNSFVHSKIVLNENSVLVGSINIDLRSFYQQFESAVFTDDKSAMNDVEKDFENVFKVCAQIDEENSYQKNFYKKILAGVLRILSPFM